MAGRRPPNERPDLDNTTDRVPAPVGDRLSLLRKSAAQRVRLTVVVHHDGGTATALLHPGSPVVIGRRPPSTLCVASSQLSRVHARFLLDPSGRILVEDLGSTNGTWLRGARIDSTEIAAGDEVVIGDALACVQIASHETRSAVAVAATGGDGLEAPVAVAPAMRDVLATAERFADATFPVILHGETGTGKEVLARFLHERSPRAGKPLVSVNCAAIPSQLVESTLFGYERGAFTGASQRQSGVFEEADGGTVFLDEIGELPLAAQAALLRVLETGRFARVGSPREIAVDLRVVAATHRDLEALCDAGTFRADLYYRLSVVVISLPPLRDRREDIEPLARRFAARAGDRAIAFTPEALAVLQAYTWPGNIRELRNVVQRAIVMARGALIDVADLPGRVRAPNLDTTTPALGAAASSTPPSGRDLRARVQEYESRVLVEALEATGWNQAEAARRLGMPARTLSHRLKTLGLKKPGT